MAIRVIDDTKLQNIAVAIQSKDNGGQMTVDEMAGRIEAIPTSLDFDMTVTDNQIKMLVYIHPEIMNCCVNYIQNVANDVEVDWGDGTPIDTAASIGDNRVVCANIFHRYNSSGLKIITLTANQSIVTLISSNGFISFAGDNGAINGNQYPNNYYRNSLLGIVFGNNTFGNVQFCKALSFAYNVYGELDFNSSLMHLTVRDGITEFPSVTGGLIQSIKIPKSSRQFKSNAFRDCTFLKLVDFTDFTMDELSQCTFGSYLFTNSTNSGLTLLFKDQETAEYAKTITNLSALSSYIKYVGEV